MSLVLVNPQFLDEVWGKVSALLAPALVYAEEDTSLDIIQLRIRRGELLLLLWAPDGNIIGAMTVEFLDNPRRRVAFISYAGGAGGATGEEQFAALCAWCRDNGASAIQAWCHERSAALLDKYGFERQYIVTRYKL